MSEDKYKESLEKGRKLMEQMLGKDHIEKQLKSRSRYPIFHEWSQRVIYGEVWSRENLDLRTRSLCVLAALTVLDRPSQLRLHVSAALRNGAKPEEIVEVIMQMAFYGGWPVASSALKIVNEVFEEKGIEEFSV